MGCICSKKTAFEANPAPRPVTPLPVSSFRVPVAGKRRAKDQARWEEVRRMYGGLEEETPETVAYHFAVRRCLGISSESVLPSPPPE